ncbi:hypothetical protein ACOMHN_033506 [Nucella lapillus]
MKVGQEERGFLLRSISGSLPRFLLPSCLNKPGDGHGRKAMKVNRRLMTAHRQKPLPLKSQTLTLGCVRCAV